eukprot:5869111-Prymnesium_polylepis.2
MDAMDGMGYGGTDDVEPPEREVGEAVRTRAPRRERDEVRGAEGRGGGAEAPPAGRSSGKRRRTRKKAERAPRRVLSPPRHVRACLVASAALTRHAPHPRRGSSRCPAVAWPTWRSSCTTVSLSSLPRSCRPHTAAAAAAAAAAARCRRSRCRLRMRPPSQCSCCRRQTERPR